MADFHNAQTPEDLPREHQGELIEEEPEPEYLPVAWSTIIDKALAYLCEDCQESYPNAMSVTDPRELRDMISNRTTCHECGRKLA